MLASRSRSLRRQAQVVDGWLMLVSSEAEEFEVVFVLLMYFRDGPGELCTAKHLLCPTVYKLHPRSVVTLQQPEQRKYSNSYSSGNDLYKHIRIQQHIQPMQHLQQLIQHLRVHEARMTIVTTMITTAITMIQLYQVRKLVALQD